MTSCLKGENTEFLHVLHGYMKDNFYCAATLDSGDISALIFGEKLWWTHVFSIFTIEPTKNLRDQRTWDRLEKVDISCVGTWLRWDMDCAITADLISTQEVTIC